MWTIIRILDYFLIIKWNDTNEKYQNVERFCLIMLLIETTHEIQNAIKSKVENISLEVQFNCIIYHKNSLL